MKLQPRAVLAALVPGLVRGQLYGWRARGPLDPSLGLRFDGDKRTGKAVIKRENEVLKVVDTGYNVPHNFQICVDFDGNDVWAGTSKGVGHGIGTGYFPKLRPAEPKTAKGGKP